MSSDAQITLALSVAVWIFTAGGFYKWVRTSIATLKKDINGIGNKIREEEKAAARRYHNASLAIMISAPATKEEEVSKLLKENS